jgi:hypothetical protein
MDVDHGATIITLQPIGITVLGFRVLSLNDYLNGIYYALACS